MAVSLHQEWHLGDSLLAAQQYTAETQVGHTVERKGTWGLGLVQSSGGQRAANNSSRHLLARQAVLSPK